MSKKALLSLVPLYILGLLFGLLVPEGNKIKDLRLDLAKQEGVLATHVHRVEQLGAVIESFSAQEEMIDRIEQALPSTPNTSALLEFLSVTIGESGMIFSEVGGISAVTTEDDVGRVVKESKISIEASGSYQSFLTLLKSLERSAYLIEVDSVSFASSQENASDFYDFLLVLRTRYMSLATKENI